MQRKRDGIIRCSLRQDSPHRLYTQAGIEATRPLVKSFCLDPHLQQQDNEQHLERFAASATFLRNLENRSGLSLRTPYHEGHSGLDQKYVNYFHGRLNSLSNDYPPVFSTDETC
jgi:hypothetical protein